MILIVLFAVVAFIVLMSRATTIHALSSSSSSSSSSMSSSSSSSRPKVYECNDTKKKQKKNPLDACIVEGLQAGHPTILIVDTNNVRGKDDFKTWNCDLLTGLAEYRRRQLSLTSSSSSSSPSSPPPLQLQIIYAMDHGCRPEVYDYSDGLIVFAGPHRTADDVIAQATRFLLAPPVPTPPDPASLSSDDDDDPQQQTSKKPLQVVVVTSDGELKQRCLRCSSQSGLLIVAAGGGRNKRKKRRPPMSDDFVSVKVFGSPSLVSLLKDINDNDDDDDSGLPPINNQNHQLIDEMERVESDMRWYTVLHPPFKSGQEQAEAGKYGPWKSSLLVQPNNANDHDHDHDDASKAETAAALIFPRKLFQEETWHRVFVAEMMQRLLDRRSQQQQHHQQPPAAKDENSPKQQQQQQQQILSDYKLFYQQHQVDNKSGTPVDTMFLDHRIRHMPHLQEHLLNYLQTSLASLTTTTTMTEEEKHDDTTIALPLAKSPAAELAIDFMKGLVQESSSSSSSFHSYKNQDEIVARYIQEAPYYLQSSRRQDLVDLLKRIAVREKRDDDVRPRWYLRDDDSLDDDGILLAATTLEKDWSFQPRRGRRSEKRRRSLREGSIEVDEELVDTGRSVEKQWLEHLQWYDK